MLWTLFQVLAGAPDEPDRDLIERLTNPNISARHAVDSGVVRGSAGDDNKTYSETVFFVRDSCTLMHQGWTSIGH